jgi:hypothetical protein
MIEAARIVRERRPEERRVRKDYGLLKSRNRETMRSPNYFCCQPHGPTEAAGVDLALSFTDNRMTRFDIYTESAKLHPAV